MTQATKDNGRWFDTKQRELARNRNWCCYMLNVALAMVACIERFTGDNPGTRATTIHLNGLRSSIDFAYDRKLNALKVKRTSRKAA